jgi:sortase A
VRRLLLRIAALVVIAWGVSQMAHAAYIHSKASLAQALIHRAWSKTAKKGRGEKPWPWADTTPVARLGAPMHRVELIVLEGASGRTLAFGPGHVAGTAKPGDHGNIVIGGHRDTHFAFLRDLAKGDALLLEDATGDLATYVVTQTDVVDRTRSEVLADHGDDRLTLVTCWPFDAIVPGGPLRYVVTAIRARESAYLPSVTPAS